MTAIVKNILATVCAAALVAGTAQLFSIKQQVAELNVKVSLLMADKHLAQK